MCRHPGQSRQELWSRNLRIFYLENGTYNHVVREAGVERNCGLDTVHMFRGQRNLECQEVLLKLFDFPPTNNGEHVGCLMQMVRNGNCKQIQFVSDLILEFSARKKCKRTTYLL